MNQPTRIICILRRHKWTFVGNSHSKVSVVLCTLTSAYGVETFGSRTKKGCLLARYRRYRGWGERLTNRDVRFSPRPRINSLIATYRLLKGLSLVYYVEFSRRGARPKMAAGRTIADHLGAFSTPRSGREPLVVFWTLHLSSASLSVSELPGSRVVCRSLRV